MAETAATVGLERVLREVGKDLNVRSVFGEAQVYEGRAIIPVASISYTGGGGGGGGPAGKPATGLTGAAAGTERLQTGTMRETGAAPAGEGAPAEGMGLGFGVWAKPIGVVEVTHDEVRWIPALDVGKLALVWSVAAALITFSLLRRLTK